jgi:hypothetical protein
MVLTSTIVLASTANAFTLEGTERVCNNGQHIWVSVSEQFYLPATAPPNGLSAPGRNSSPGGPVFQLPLPLGGLDYRAEVREAAKQWSNVAGSAIEGHFPFGITLDENPANLVPPMAGDGISSIGIKDSVTNGNPCTPKPGNEAIGCAQGFLDDDACDGKFEVDVALATSLIMTSRGPSSELNTPYDNLSPGDVLPASFDYVALHELGHESDLAILTILTSLRS